VAAGSHGVDGGLVGTGPVGDDDLDVAAPAVALFGEEPRQGRRVAVGDHGQHLTRVTVLDDGDVAVPAAHRCLVHQQHPAPAGSAVRTHHRGPRGDQGHDGVPADLMPSGHRPDRHHLGVGHQRLGQAAGESTVEHRMVLEVTRPAATTGEPASGPQQGDPTTRHRQVPDLLGAGVVHGPSAEPAVRTSRPRPRRRHRHHQLVDFIDNDFADVYLSQVQPDLHSVGGHRGLLELGGSNTDSSGTPTRVGGPSTNPSPHAYAQPQQLTVTRRNGAGANPEALLH
jgi:hypothetical protein